MLIFELIVKLEEIRDGIGDVDVMADHISIDEVKLIRDYEDSFGNPIGDIVNLE